MSCVDALRLAIHKTKLERFLFVQAGKLESHDGSSIGEAGVMVDVRGMFRLLGGTGDFENATVKIGLFDLRHTVGSGALPTVANGLQAVAGFLTLEGVVENEHAILAKPVGVIPQRNGGLRLGCVQCGQRKEEREYEMRHGDGWSERLR